MSATPSKNNSFLPFSLYLLIFIFFGLLGYLLARLQEAASSSLSESMDQAAPIEKATPPEYKGGEIRPEESIGTQDSLDLLSAGMGSPPDWGPPSPDT